MGELDELFGELHPATPPPGRPVRDDGLTADKRWRHKHNHITDQDGLVREIEGHFQFHGAPLHQWRWMRTQEIAVEVLGEALASRSMQVTLGRALGATERRHAAMTRRHRMGYTYWLMPPSRYEFRRRVSE